MARAQGSRDNHSATAGLITAQFVVLTPAYRQGESNGTEIDWLPC